MRKVTAEEARERLGELLAGLDAGEDVLIEAEGAPVAVLVPLARYAAEEEARLAWLKAAIAEGEADLAAGRCLEVADPDALVEAIMTRPRERRQTGKDAA